MTLLVDIRRERINRGLSLRSAAVEIGISRETYEKVEKGEPVHPATAKKVADFYGLIVTDVWPIEAFDRSAA